MSTDLATRPSGPIPASQLEAIKEQVKLVVNTDFVPAAYRGKPHAVLACILYGREIGLEPMESLAEIHMVDGKPSLSAKAMLKLARQAGHSITGETDDVKAIVRGKRGDNGDEITVIYTIDQAKRAGLDGKANWKKHAEDMLWARAVSRLCRRLFGDVFGSLPYGPEELEPLPIDRAVAVTDDLPTLDADYVEENSSREPLPPASARDDQEPGGGPEPAAPAPSDSLFAAPPLKADEDARLPAPEER